MNKLSIILPTHNEVRSLEYVIKKWSDCLSNAKIVHEFVICEDGSTDGTKELIEQLQKQYCIVNDSAVDRRGYGGGVLSGVNSAKYDYILCIDSDGQCLPDSFLEFWRAKDSADITIGIRKPRMDPFIRKCYSGCFLVLHRILFPSKISDPSCPYVLAKSSIFKSLVPYMSYMKEGFWWGFVAAGLKSKKTFQQINIKHFERYDGSSVVYKPSKMPSIIVRNIIGLIKLRLC